MGNSCQDKKNGRLGQEQSGVDVYGIPKNEKKYWGIQAKGKDDYTNAKLTEKEILNEIEKAKSFLPKLGVYIIASTTNKDAKIEEFIRLKDFENRKDESFEILLYCWEDIVDLIEENRDTYNWYLNGINQKNKFDFKISFNQLEDSLTLFPTYVRTTTKYILSNKTSKDLLFERIKLHNQDFTIFNLLHSNKINKSWCEFELNMENTGSVVIEDWRLIIKFISGVKKLDTGFLMFPRISLTDFVDDENKTITYRPIKNKPLIQKDNQYFEISLLPDLDVEKIVFELEILARDFNRKEIAEISIVPNYIEETKSEEIENNSQLSEDKVEFGYHIVEKEKKNKA